MDLQFHASMKLQQSRTEKLFHRDHAPIGLTARPFALDFCNVREDANIMAKKPAQRTRRQKDVLQCRGPQDPERVARPGERSPGDRRPRAAAESGHSVAVAVQRALQQDQAVHRNGQRHEPPRTVQPVAGQGVHANAVGRQRLQTVDRRRQDHQHPWSVLLVETHHRGLPRRDVQRPVGMRPGDRRRRGDVERAPRRVARLRLESRLDGRQYLAE